MNEILLFFLLCRGTAPVESRTVLASYMGHRLEGRIMANGKRFRAKDPTIAAHKTLPKGTRLLVVNKANNRRLVVTVQDRGPFKEGRDLDLSYAGAKKLDYVSQGVAQLEMSVISN